MAEVTLKNISKVYPGVERPAVDNVNIEIRDREFLVLVGPSGCGKSTTLRMVAGLEEATGGDILIGGRRVNDVAPKDRDIAMIFQNYALYPHMTVYENLAFPLKMRKTPRAEIDAAVRAAAEMLGITPYLDRKPRALSGGQRQRVAVGRAIVRKPQVFLFDEPLSNLDAKMRVTMRNEITSLHRRLQTTVIYVTHDQVEAMTMGDRIVVMHDGHVQQMDVPQTIYDAPVNKFVAGFIGSPPMNFIAGKLREESGVLQFESASLKFAIPESRRAALKSAAETDVVFGIRPENFAEEPKPGIPADSWAKLDANVENKEPLGSELILYLTTSTGALVARLDPDAHAEIGKSKSLQINTAKGHFFDAKSEARIG